MRGEQETVNLEALLGASRQTLISAAHELKAPLSLIRMYANCLEQKDLTPSQRRQYSSRLRYTAEHMLQLTSGLLEGQRWAAGHIPLEPVNTSIVCEEVLHELTPAARENNQFLTLHTPLRPSVAVGNSELLRNVVFNIVFNSLKHTPANTNISLHSALRGTKSHISVIDTGPGFTAQAIRHINRGSDGRLQAQPSRSGSGLGLAVARQLLAVMNGTLQLKSSTTGGHCLLLLNASRQLSLPL